MSSNVSFVGNLYSDPQLKGDGDSKRAIFSIACEEGTGDNKKTVSVNVTAFGKLATNVAKSLKKGQSVIVMGRFNGYKKAVVLDGEEKNLDMLAVTAFHVGPDMLWQTVEVTKVTSGGSGNSGGGDSGSGGSSGNSDKAARPSDNPEDF